MSPATIRKFHTVLREALQTAVEDGLALRNVAAGIDLPKDTWRERRALLPEECGQLLGAARGSRMFAPVLLGGRADFRVNVSERRNPWDALSHAASLCASGAIV